jgi:argininosuccinate lyase
MLGECEIIPREDGEQIKKWSTLMKKMVGNNEVEFLVEDIHMHIEKLLIEKMGKWVVTYIRDVAVMTK